jgi:hypothetical protein
MTHGHKRIVLLLGAAGLLAAGLARCVSGERGSGASTTPVSLAAVDSGAPPAAPSAISDVAPTEAQASADAGLAPTAAPSGDAGAAATASSTAAAFFASTTPVDRDFLADVERLSKRSPPPATAELIKMQHGGASRAELERFIDQSFGKEVAVRTPALRWLEQVMPTGKPTAPAVPDMSGKNPGRIQTPKRD